MGLFDPPTKSIIKRVPRDWIPQLSSIQVFAEDQIPDELGATKKSALVAMVLGAWVSNHVRYGSMEMASWDLASTETMANNCARVAGEYVPMALQVISELFERGLMPEGLPNTTGYGKPEA